MSVYAYRIALLLMLVWLAGCRLPTGPEAPVPESVAIPTLESSPVATATATPLEAEEVATPARCAQAVTTFNIRTDLGLAGRVQVTFRDTSTVELGGWGVGHSESAENPPFSRFHRYTLDLDAGTFTPIAPLPLPPDLTDCADCTGDVLAVLPDGETTLVALQGKADRTGIWLDHPQRADATRLVAFVPQDSVWGYTADGTLLWLEYSEAEYGRTLVLVYLTDAVRVVQPATEALDPTRYRLAFSSLAPTVLSYPQPDENPEAPPELATYNVSQDPAVLQTREQREELVRAFWDPATNTYLAVETGGEAVRVTTLGGDPRVVLLLAALQQMNANIDSVAEWRTSFTTSNTFALAPDDSSFVIADGRGRLNVFGCEAGS